MILSPCPRRGCSTVPSQAPIGQFKISDAMSTCALGARVHVLHTMGALRLKKNVGRHHQKISGVSSQIQAHSGGQRPSRSAESVISSQQSVSECGFGIYSVPGVHIIDGGCGLAAREEQGHSKQQQWYEAA